VLRGLASRTSAPVRTIASGVRSSCDASATNRRWLSNEASSRPIISSKVSASSFSSSRGPSSAIRSCSRSPVIRRVVAVSVRRGRSMRPAMNQEAPSPATAVTANTPRRAGRAHQQVAPQPGDGLALDLEGPELLVDVLVAGDTAIDPVLCRSTFTCA
jgi:hypothetical protein